MVIVVFGLPGVGKTYFASTLAKRIGALHLSTDKVRKDMNLRDYDEQSKLLVYEELLNKVERASRTHQHIILDATLYKRVIADEIRQKILALGSQLVWIEIVADESLIIDRLRKSRPDSDADYKVYLKVKKEFEPFPGDHLTIESTNNNIDEMIRIALKAITQIK